MGNVESENDKDECTAQKELVLNVEHEGEQNGSVSPTQLDVEYGQDGMEPVAKRAKVCQEHVESEQHKDVLSMDEHNTFVHFVKRFQLP